MAEQDFVDATTFLGMHCATEDLRLACATFFAERLDGTLTMTLEEVGHCDDVVWGHPREVQDAYYPFMDRLHTDVRVRRFGYRDQDLITALTHTPLAGLPPRERLTLAVVLNRGGVLHTLNRRLLVRTDLPVRAPRVVRERVPFTGALERLYQDSLVLRVPADELDGMSCSVG